MIPLGILASSIRAVLPDELLAPTDLAASLIGGLVKLTWTDRNTNATGHRIYRSSSPMDTQAMPPPVDEIGPNVTEWEDTDTPADQVAYYIVSAVRDGEEAFSDEVMIDTAPVPDSDPHWDNVVSLLHFDGDLTDEVGRIWTVSGTGVTVEDTEGVFGGRLRSEGVNRSYVRSPVSEDFTFGVDDFTLEFWLNYRRPTAGPCGILDFRTSGVWQQPRPAIYTSGEGDLVYVTEGVTVFTTTPPEGWTHIAMCRHNGVGRMFLGGVLMGEWSDTTNYLAGWCTLAYPGDNITSYRPLIGDLDELRITKGVARYTENFTPPTEPFPNQ